MRPNAAGTDSRAPHERNGVVRAYAGVTAVTAVAIVIAFALISRAVGVAADARRDADASRARIAAANDVLGYAARLGTATAQSVSGQAAAAVAASIDRLRAADAVAVSSFPTSDADTAKLDDLRSQTRSAAQDMFAAAGRVTESVSAAPSDLSPPAAVAEFAARENAYTDAVAGEAAFYDSVAASSTLAARVESASFGVVVLLILAAGFGVVIVPAHRRLARSTEVAIRSQEQEKRIGSEVARHVAERDRREAEAQFQALFRRSLVGVALTDSKGWILESNESLQRMLGYTEQELRGSQFGEWALDGEAGAESVDDPRARRERVFRRKNGTTFWVEQTSTAAPGGSADAPAGIIWMVQDIEKRKIAEWRLQHDATHDRLTGLNNRGFFDEAVSTASRRFAAGDCSPFAVCMIDLDSFKFVNDTRGHAAGDALLAAVGERLRSWARDGRIAARYGGDEFAVFIPDVESAECALEHASSLRSLFDAPVDIGGAVLDVTASIGVCMSGAEVPSGEAIMRAADAATYRAKALGRARAVLYDSAMAQYDDLRRRIGGELKSAVGLGQLVLEFQPIVSLPDRSCTGFEALVRWDHPELGRIAPSIFIPVAEEVGLMREVGAWILRTACEHLARWQRDAGVPDCKLNVNVSTHQMADPGFLDVLRSCIISTGVDARRLGLELTETAMLDRNGLANETLSKIRAMGIPVVLDDFGTGYSSLSYLQLLPMDALKIDQSFVRSPHDGLASPAIVHALISLAKSLGISVVAEGVETEQQAAHLERIGCRAAQGYLFSRSLRAEAALEFLVSHAQLHQMA